MESPIVAYVLIPLLIMIARITDVSIGTMRVIFVSKGYKLFAAICGFFEILVWIVAITQIMNNLTSPLYYVAYAAGFASGNYIGMCIEERIALGNVMLTVVTPNELVALTKFLKERGYGVTMFPGQGLHGTVKILISVVPRSDIEDVVNTIKEVNPQAFYTIEDIRFVNESSIGYKTLMMRKKRRNGLYRPFRMGK